MCHHLDGLDTTADDFVWRGVFAQASPEEQDAIRAETLPIIIPAIMEHPWLQLRASVIDYLAQLSSFNLMDTRFPNWAELTPTDMIYHIDVHIYLRWLIVLSLVHYCIVAVALLSLVCMWGDLTPRAKQLIGTGVSRHTTQLVHRSNIHTVAALRGEDHMAGAVCGSPSTAP